MPTSSPSFWSRLLEAMRDKGIPQTQIQAGKLAGVTQPAARKWAHGGLPELDKATAIANYLGVSVVWLLQGVGPKHPPPGQDDQALRELLNAWPTLPAEGRRTLAETAKLMRPKATGDEA